MYEVCPVEPLHDLKGHIVSLWDVLVLFLTQEQQLVFEGLLKACFNNKDKVRGCDDLFSAIIVYLQLKDLVTNELVQLLETLVKVFNSPTSLQLNDRREPFC